MASDEKQAFYVPRGAVVRVPHSVRLAAAERERLWKGLERFANCDDSLTGYEALGKAFRGFCPVVIYYYLHPEPRNASTSTPKNGSDQTSEEIFRQNAIARIDWHPICHQLFLFYRDTLRNLWARQADDLSFFIEGPVDFLMGTSRSLKLLFAEIKIWLRDRSRPCPSDYPTALLDACEPIVLEFPTAEVVGFAQLEMIWSMGDFLLYPFTDFQRAFYLLFRQSWRARICRRCSHWFVARKPKQVFCDKICNAASRRYSQRKWWHKTGAKRRSALYGTKQRRGSRGSRGRKKR